MKNVSNFGRYFVLTPQYNAIREETESMEDSMSQRGDMSNPNQGPDFDTQTYMSAENNRGSQKQPLVISNSSDDIEIDDQELYQNNMVSRPLNLTVTSEESSDKNRQSQ